MPPSKSLYQRILGPYRLSHHPLCDNFKDHVYIIRGRKVCRGCTMQYSGMLLAFIIIIIGNILSLFKNFTELQIGIILYCLIIPTFLTSFLIQNRKVKDMARFLLGMSFTLAIIIFIFTPNLIVKGWILINFIPGYLYLNKRRKMKNEEECVKCSEYENSPYCPGFQVYADRENIFYSQLKQGGIKDPFALPPEDFEE